MAAPPWTLSLAIASKTPYPSNLPRESLPAAQALFVAPSAFQGRGPLRRKVSAAKSRDNMKQDETSGAKTVLHGPVVAE